MRPTVTRDTKSNSLIIAFTYVDEHGVRRRYRRSAGRGVGEKEARQRARELYRLMERDRRAFVEVFVQPAPVVVPVPFAELANRWLEEHVQIKLRPTTRRTHEQIVRVHLVPHFGALDARAITKADVVAYVAGKVRAGLSPKTANNHLSALRTLFDFGRDPLALLDANPAEGVDPLRIDRQGHAFLTREEGERYLAAVASRDPAFLPALTTALRGGLRLGELCELRWRDVDLDAGAIVVSRSRWGEHAGPTKGNRERRVPISPQVRACLAAHRPADARADDLVFQAAEGGPLNGDRLKHPHRRAAVAIGRPSLRLHDLRHSFASQLVQAGAPLNAVQAMLGHRQIATTLRYAHLAPDTLSGWVTRLDAPGSTERP